MQRQILVTGNIDEASLNRLRDNNFIVDYRVDFLNDNQLQEALENADAYLLGGDEIATKHAISKANKLKLISFWGVGYNSFIDTKAATEKGIYVSNTPGTLTQSVAELTVGHVINLYRRISIMDSQVKAGNSIKQITPSLENANVGIIGMGEIGSRIACILKQGFGSNIYFYNRNSKSKLDYATYLEKDELLTTCDIIILMASTNDDNLSMISKHEFSLMKPTAILVNTARAKLVDSDALYDALSQRKIAGAAFDGYYQEPLPLPTQDPYKLLTLPEGLFIVTPHIAAFTHTAHKNISEMAINTILTFFENGNDKAIVNADAVAQIIDRKNYGSNQT